MKTKASICAAIEKERSLEMALAEVNRLTMNHLVDPRFVFEYWGQKTEAKFVQAWVNVDAHPIAYRVHLVVPSDLLVVGACYIIANDGRRVQGTALTIRGESENMVVIRVTNTVPSFS